MIDFYNGQITDILPDNIKSSPVTKAVSYAISNMTKKIVDLAACSGIYASIDSLDEEILNLLAVELRTKYYGEWMNLEEKRRAVKKTLLWYCRAGTLPTVKELVNFVFQDAYTEEWFQYGGGAFFFRVIVNILNQDISLEKYLGFIRSLYGVKNTRSHLEAVLFSCKKRTEIKSVAVGGIGNVIKVKTRVVSRISSSAKSRNVSALSVNQNIKVKADNSIKEDEVYILNGDGAKERVFAQNGAIVKIGKENG